MYTDSVNWVLQRAKSFYNTGR